MFRPLALAIGLALGSAAPALAHGDYDWINKGGYRSQKGEACCGKDDCFRLDAKDIEQERGGIRVPSHGVTVPYNEVQRSEDENYWICRTTGKLRCFFAPDQAS
jgi:hypothetical protein